MVREEFPWQDSAGEDRFLDIIAQREDVVATVECKKTQKEILTFLRPVAGPNGLRETTRFRGIFTSQIQDSTLRIEIFRGEWDLAPRSLESMYCVVSTTEGGRDQRLLERDAHRVIRGTDACAQDRRAAFIAGSLGEPDRVLVPIIVTNARLFVAEYDPTMISLDSGQFADPVPEARPVRWVRFRKAFTTEGGVDHGDRTVFVTSGSSFAELLTEIASTPARLQGGRGPAIPPRPRRS